MSVKEWPGKTEKFLREVSLEMQKVSWPSRQSVIGSTIVVLVVVFFLSVYMWGLDLVWGQALAKILSYSSPS